MHDKMRTWAAGLLVMWCSMVSALAADFTHGVDVSGSLATIWFKPAATAAWVDAHYDVDGGPMQNVRMVYQAASARYEQRVPVATGTRLGYWFTYAIGTAATDSARFTFTVGGGAPTPPPLTPPVTPGGTDLPTGSGVMTFKLVNGTSGAYRNDQVYFAVIGYNPDTRALSYVDRTGRLLPAALGDNDAANRLVKNGQNYTNYFHKLSDVDWVSLPRIDSGRMFISVGSPMYIKVNRAGDGSLGFAGPDLGNPTDPNQDVNFEWVEFTIDKYGYHGNTTRVDQFGVPLRTLLLGRDGYDRTLGETATRAQIFADFEAQVPAEFRPLVQRPYRIVAPAKGNFNHGRPQGNHFDAYVDQVWRHYAANDLVFTAEAGTFRGRVVGNDFVFSKDGGPSNIYIRGKPTTQAILEGSGNLAAGSSVEKVVQAQITAAFNRHLLVTVDPSRWSDSASYYLTSPANHFSAFWHTHSIDGLAYGFCYDDVRGKSSLLEHPDPKGLIITVGC